MLSQSTCNYLPGHLKCQSHSGIWFTVWSRFPKTRLFFAKSRIFVLSFYFVSILSLDIRIRHRVTSTRVQQTRTQYSRISWFTFTVTLNRVHITALCALHCFEKKKTTTANTIERHIYPQYDPKLNAINWHCCCNCSVALFCLIYVLF